MLDTNPTTRLSLSIPEAMQATSLGRNSIFDEIKAGRLRSFTVGRRRLVSEKAIRDWIADREAEQARGAA